ncbi:hypothetical protein VB834_30130 [Limnoraphis robusta Tam1]|uniref:Uncharacterized protein n=1 Tax=Limnoraphis robusta CCNP1315 TaxID=3110306 RepID=A0ABU5U0Y5_9CYAN|nr:hypothetical protein [Limnoraphis robusta]MEA5496619.1 hypothetical protein [Limnoraphis robusta BA-68 BA1]MEA5520587.1 hypothetical protein [Limnoraphis robusta CCNP1315]MEA5543293.1 hypothetical protein [Limnoraphis robusta Tam1]MEA5547215.1 hypothetical protein [Limnoraphis robusta CCNP1324]
MNGLTKRVLIIVELESIGIRFHPNFLKGLGILTHDLKINSRFSYASQKHWIE